MPVHKIATEFFHQLRNRDQRQGDGKHTAISFREKFFPNLIINEKFNYECESITLDFDGVEIVGPSFANEAFAYYTKYAAPEDIYKKIIFKNINPVDREIIEWEVQSGYKRYA